MGNMLLPIIHGSTDLRKTYKLVKFGAKQTNTSGAFELSLTTLAREEANQEAMSLPTLLF